MRDRGDTIAEWAAERARIVRLCAHLTGDAQAAEDLAQETLVEAWRHAHKLHDPRGREPWLRAIARNVCLRWRQRRRHEAGHLAPTEPDGNDAPPDRARQAAAADLEIALERGELADLLDRALALLPPTTRDVLVARYIDESPHGEIAARLGLSESAVKMQVARGKLTLRRVLTTQFPAEAQALGVSVPETAGERETRIWCPICGRGRLVGRFDRGARQFALRCPACTGMFTTGGDALWPASLDTITGFKPALSRLLAWGTAYWHGRAGGNIPCQHLPASSRPCPACWRGARPIGTAAPEGTSPASTAGVSSPAGRGGTMIWTVRIYWPAITSPTPTARPAARPCNRRSEASPWGCLRANASGARTRACVRWSSGRSRREGAPRW